jgi:hypothetical protein
MPRMTRTPKLRATLARGRSGVKYDNGCSLFLPDKPLGKPEGSLKSQQNCQPATRFVASGPGTAAPTKCAEVGVAHCLLLPHIQGGLAVRMRGASQG